MEKNKNKLENSNSNDNQAHVKGKITSASVIRNMYTPTRVTAIKSLKVV